MRRPCNHEVLVTLNGAGQKALLINISEGGARMKGLYGADIGNRLMLRVMNKTLMADVRWLRGNLIGLRFTTPLELTDLTIIRQGMHRPG
jgi:hypothetical protein